MIVRALHILNLLLIVPIMCLGLMVSMSGGSSTTPFYRIGMLLLVASPIVALICMLLAEVIWRQTGHGVAILVGLIPLVVWGVLITWLQRVTGFFS